LIITSASVDRFSKFFHCQIPEKTPHELLQTFHLTSSVLLHYLVKLRLTIAADFNGVLHVKPQNSSC